MPSVLVPITSHRSSFSARGFYLCEFLIRAR